MAPHASGGQRSKGPQGLTLACAHASQTEQPNAQASCSQLDDFFLNPQIWRSVGLRGPVKMQVQFDNQKLLHPEPRAPRIGWFKNSEPLTMLASHSSLGPSRHAEKYSSSQLHLEAIQHMPVPMAAQPTNHYHARQPARASPPAAAPAPLLPPAFVLAPAPPPIQQHTQQQQQPMEPLWQRPDIQTLVRNAPRRPRTSSARLRCSMEKVQKRVSIMLQPPVPQPLQSATASGDLAGNEGLAVFEQTLFAQMAPVAVCRPVLAPPPPPISMPAAQMEVAASTPQGEADVASMQFQSQQRQQPKVSPTVTVAAVQAPAHTPGKVPIILLPADGHCVRVPAVCISPMPERTAPRAWDSLPAAPVRPLPHPFTTTTSSFGSHAAAPVAQADCKAAVKQQQQQQQQTHTAFCSGSSPSPQSAMDIVLATCPPAHSDASSQHGFTSLRSCGSGSLEDATARCTSADSQPHEPPTTVPTDPSDSDQQPIVMMALDSPQYQMATFKGAFDSHMAVGSGQQHQAMACKVQAVTAPASPSSPLSDVDMAAA